MRNLVITTNQIYSTAHPIQLSAGDSLMIAQGVLIVGDDGFDAIAGPSVTDTGSTHIAVEGYVDGSDDGIDFNASQSGNQYISIGSTGSVVGQNLGISLNELNHNFGQLINNSGYIYGDGALGVGLGGASTAEVVNSGHIGSNGTAISLAPQSVASIVNSASGVISGTQAISIVTAAATQIVNAGEITGGVLNARVIYLGAGNATVSNSGDIEGASRAIDFTTGGNDSVENSGTISVTGSQAIYGGGDYYGIENSGKISAADSVIDLLGNSGGYDWVVNDIGGSIAAQNDDYAVFIETDVARIINHGSMNGDVFTNADGSTFANTGQYSGEVLYNGGNALIRNTGVMTHDGYSAAPVPAATTSAVAASNAPQSTGYDVYIAGAAGEDDLLVNAYSGIMDATGSIAIEHGSAGTFRFINRGDIYGDIDANGTTSAVNAGEIGGDVNFGAAATLFANRGAVDGNVTFTGAGNIYRGYLGSVTGEVFGSGADGRYFGGVGDDTFDMTASGANLVVGGDGDDTFIFNPTGLTAGTVIRGGAGDDTLTFASAGSISASALANVQTIETVNLGAGANFLTVTDALVTSADSHALTINGNSGIDGISLAAVTTAGDVATVFGGAGSDNINAGGAEDVFGYKKVTDSTGTVFDNLANVNFNADRFSISNFASPVTAINSAVTTGSLSSATFNSDLTTDLAGKLSAHAAVLFTPNAGTYSGKTFMVIDVNGTAGYQANADLVIHLIGQTGSLTTADFT